MFCVYHVEDSEDSLVPAATFYTNVTDALNWANDLRKQGFKFITIASELENNVTKMGVAGLESHEYEWKKRR